MAEALKAPFPYFGGKRRIANIVWQRFGEVRQYIEPFCGSSAVLLAAPHTAKLETVNDVSFYIANFWRCVKHTPDAVAEYAKYPISHVDLDARHVWLTDPERTLSLRVKLADPDWPGDAKIAGWWVWGVCAWVSRGWCIGAVSPRVATVTVESVIPILTQVGQGIQTVPWAEDPTRWLSALSARLRHVRITHGDWTRCMNTSYGKGSTAIFFDPPYKSFEYVYSKNKSIANDVEAWCRANGHDARIALCGHAGDYDLPGWDVFQWSRSSGGPDTKEAIWFSPTCLPPAPETGDLIA